MFKNKGCASSVLTMYENRKGTAYPFQLTVWRNYQYSN